MKNYKYLLSAFVLILFTGCSLLTTDEDGPQLRMQTTKSTTQTTTFNGDTLVFAPYVPTDSLPPRDYPPFTNTIQDGQIVINGYYLSSGTWQPKASISKTNNTITLTLERPDVNSSNYMPVGYFYDAYIFGLDNNQYTVKIIHQGDMMCGIEGEAHTVFNKEFMIE